MCNLLNTVFRYIYWCTASLWYAFVVFILKHIFNLKVVPDTNQGIEK